MKLISKSIHKNDTQADDRLIASMEAKRYSGTELRDIIVARYRNRNLRMRVLVAFNQTVKLKKLADEVTAAIKTIDGEVAALDAIASVLDDDNVVSLDAARGKQQMVA